MNTIARAYIDAEHDATDHKCYLSKIEPLHGVCVGSTTPEAADPISRIMLLTSLSMVIASTQTRHRSAYIPDHGGDG